MVLHVIQSDRDWLQKEAKRSVEVGKHIIMRPQRPRVAAWREGHRWKPVRVKHRHIETQNGKARFQQRRNHQAWLDSFVVQYHVVLPETSPLVPGLEDEQSSVPANRMKMVDVRLQAIGHSHRVKIDLRQIAFRSIEPGVEWIRDICLNR